MADGMTHHAAPELIELLVPIADLVPAPRNARTHSDEQIADIKASLQTYGQDQPLVVQQDGMIVRVGNGRLRAAAELGWTHIAAIVVDADEPSMIARQIMDNRAAEKGGTDETILAELLEGVWKSHLPTGYTDLEVAQLLEHAPDANGGGDGEEVPPEDPVADAETAAAVGRVAPGDLWALGDHRLLCGDCTSGEAVARLADGAQADQILTDPPYGVAYTGAAGTIANDDGEVNYREFFSRFLELAPLKKKNTAYVFMSGKELHHLRLALDDAGFTWGDYLIWAKQQAVMGRKDYNAQHEYIVYGWKGVHRFYGRPSATTVISFDRPYTSPLHPTMKPTELLSRLMRDGSRPGALIYDPFTGSGSTIIAGEMSGRRVMALELDPAYASVAIARWERWTGETARRED